MRPMTFYDDAEIAGVEAVRLAAAEWDGPPQSAAISAVAMRLYEQHGSDGLAALIVALSRWTSVAFRHRAEERGMTIEQFLDEWEMHKLEQHELDREERNEEGA